MQEKRNKTNFNNARINRWVEKTQESDFTIEYRKPEEMIVADALSRVYTHEELEKKRMVENCKEKQIEGKKVKYVKEIEGIK